MTNPVSDERRAGLRIVIENDPYLMDHERADLLALLDAPPAPTSEERREMARIINLLEWGYDSYRPSALPLTDAEKSMLHTIRTLVLSAPEPKVISRNFPAIVCLCGSTRFMDAFFEAGWSETLAGRIVLSIGVCKHATDHGGEALGKEVVELLDELHKRKIDLADEVFILNVGGYVGDSTKSEIRYAIAHGKPVRWLEPESSAKILRDLGHAVKPEEGKK